MKRIGLDVCGPFPVLKKGNRYLKKFQEAEYVASKLVNRFISIFGVPLQLLTDVGSNFEPKVLQEVCKLMGMTYPERVSKGLSLMEWLSELFTQFRI